MRIHIFLSGVLCSSLLEQAFSALRQPIKQNAGSDPTLDEIGKEMKEAGENIKKAAENTFRKFQYGPGQHGNAEKPLMDSIEVMRAMMCWGRPDLIDHEKCMEWMSDHCEDEQSGHGYCTHFEGYVCEKWREGHDKAEHYKNEMGLSCKGHRKGSTGQIGSPCDANGDCDSGYCHPSSNTCQEKPAAVRIQEKKEDRNRDRDGDGVEDRRDAFPDNPLEWRDRDGDGVGDNGDYYPDDPKCAHKGECDPKPAAAKAKAAPGAAPSPAGGGAPAPSPFPMSDGLKMKGDGQHHEGLPSQGYNEHSMTYVTHKDKETMTRDWRREWPAKAQSPAQSVKDICAENPNLTWCKLKQSKKARMAYARSHP